VSESWQSVARGIPVWAGARVNVEGSDGLGRCVDVWVGVKGSTDPEGNSAPLVWVARNDLSDADGCDTVAPADCGPDLSDADTQASYLRRLAIRLGCDEQAAGEGVVFADRHTGWAIMAGSWCWDSTGGCVMAWERLVAAGEPDRLLALSRAWSEVVP